jgi:hypothetical protein
MFFNRTQNDANYKYFYMTVWSHANGRPDTVIYSQLGERPAFAGLNEFVLHRFDTVLYIADTFYVGWIQTDDILLNVGFDMNNDASEKVFYNIGSGWVNIPFEGSVMIRPVFSDAEIVSAEEVRQNEISVYPNPANDQLHIEAEGINDIALMDMYGRQVRSCNNCNTLSVQELPSGFYMLRINTEQGIITRKVIVNHGS